MDVSLPDIGALAPGAGVLALLSWLVVALARQGASDRRDYGARIDRLDEQHAAEMAEQAARHDKQIAELREQIAELRAEVKVLRREFDDEWRKRLRAEADAAYWKRQAGVTDDGRSD